MYRKRPGRYAAIDIGTVTSRLLVADVDADGVQHILTRGYAITNLGEGVDTSCRLLPEAVERVAAAVAGFVQQVKNLGPDNEGRQAVFSAVATSAARDAENGLELVDRLAQMGIELKIIPGKREAELSFAGVSAAFPGESIAVVDVGGGSTEVIVGEAGCVPESAHSFNIGCRRATERFLKGDPPLAEEIIQARAWLREELAAGPFDLNHLAGHRLVAVAGTATSVVSMRDAMDVYDSSHVHLSEVTALDLEVQLQRLAAMRIEQRRQVVGLDPERAPVIVAGMLILQEVMSLGSFASFTVSESDILAGIIAWASNLD